MSERSSDISLELPCDERAPARVRQAVQSLPGVGWMLGDAMLVASELVTNAVLHSGCSSEELIHVRLGVGGDRLSISVRDHGVSAGEPKPRPAPDPFGGVGLRLVEQLAFQWGSERCEQGHRVWAELPLTEQPWRRSSSELARAG